MISGEIAANKNQQREKEREREREREREKDRDEATERQRESSYCPENPPPLETSAPIKPTSVPCSPKFPDIGDASTPLFSVLPATIHTELTPVDAACTQASFTAAKDADSVPAPDLRRPWLWLSGAVATSAMHQMRGLTVADDGVATSPPPTSRGLRS